MKKQYLSFAFINLGRRWDKNFSINVNKNVDADGYWLKIGIDVPKVYFYQQPINTHRSDCHNNTKNVAT